MRIAKQVVVRLEAKETAWEIAPGRSVSAWGDEGRVLGPMNVARVGDTLVAQLVAQLVTSFRAHVDPLARPGREGGVTLVNRRSMPEHEIAAGQVERWRVVNACSARYVRLSIGGRPFRVIGRGGRATNETTVVTEKLLAPTSCSAGRRCSTEWSVTL